MEIFKNGKAEIISGEGYVTDICDRSNPVKVPIGQLSTRRGD